MKENENQKNYLCPRLPLKPVRLAILIPFLFFGTLKAEKLPYIEWIPIETPEVPTNMVLPEEGAKKFVLFKATGKNKKLIATVLAFPFPFGIVGLHRIYLGCAPHVPVAYIATVGGGFGVLPFIDFWALLLSKDIEQFAQNGQVFMWLR